MQKKVTIVILLVTIVVPLTIEIIISENDDNDGWPLIQMLVTMHLMHQLPRLVRENLLIKMNLQSPRHVFYRAESLSLKSYSKSNAILLVYLNEFSGSADSDSIQKLANSNIIVYIQFGSY